MPHSLTPFLAFPSRLSLCSQHQAFNAHYIFTLSQSAPATDPLVLWQQGGPGSSGLGFGYFAELGPYQLSARSLSSNSSAIPRPIRNLESWDAATNLLIFEHPPGTGFSYCADADDKPVVCEWNDQTQASAYYATLAAWYEKFAEFQQHSLFIIGESYAGLLIPFLVREIMAHPDETAAKQLQAIAVGNGCPGTAGSTPEKTGTCNGPYGNYDTQHIFELVAGHSGVSRKLHDEVVAACKFPCKAPTWSEDCMTHSPACEALLQKYSAAVGLFNIYNFYDNCGSGNQVVDAAGAVGRGGSGAAGTFSELRERFSRPASGGQVYPCGTGAAAAAWCNNDAARAGFNMKPRSFYPAPWAAQAGAAMNYTHYTGASYDLYPSIVSKYRVVIYNGDVDACVPYNSNEDWTATLAAQQGWEEAEAWRPWILDSVPAGYVTSYKTNGAADFTFVTIKESGHMVPQYQPARALAFFQRWLKGGPY